MQQRKYSSVYAAQPKGAGAELVTLEADLTRGLHSFSIIGLPDKAVAEARDRISAAIRCAGFSSPKATNRRIILSFSPADLKKEGSHYDLPLAIAYLAAAGEISLPKEKSLFCGELKLDGTIRAVHGILPQILEAKRSGFTSAYVPAENSQEACLVEGIKIYAPGSLQELVAHLKGSASLLPCAHTQVRMPPPSPEVDLKNIRGQESAKRAVEIAAAGKHNLVLYGPPGTGKTLLARAMPGIVPPLTTDEMLETTAIHSIAGSLPRGEILQTAPFRAPHHTISYTALVGGGAVPHPGEITLAHNGILFFKAVTQGQMLY